jgi:hypothetical protein
MNALERLELELNSDPYDDFDWWDNPALTCETDPAFEASEHPKIKYVWDEWSDEDKRPRGMNLDKWNYPHNHERFEQKIGGRNG